MTYVEEKGAHEGHKLFVHFLRVPALLKGKLGTTIDRDENNGDGGHPDAMRELIAGNQGRGEAPCQ